MSESELRNTIANDIDTDLRISLENCACLGRDAYGEYIEKLHRGIIQIITKNGEQ